MKRFLYNELKTWKAHPDRRPLLLLGARQVGKTWLMNEFGKNEYKNIIYIDFFNEPEIAKQFDYDLKPERIVTMLSAEKNETITPVETLIIFDEIQECNRALNSLKYFADNAPQYHIMAAGSFLGVSMHEGASFPVGKVDRLTLYPLSFYEFLDAIGEQRMIEAAKSLDHIVIQGLAPKFTELLRTYFFVGGMPRSVSAYSRRRDFAEVRKIQKEILTDYQSDFSKHISAPNIPKVGMIWNYIPTHLAKEKKRVIYAEIKKGGRASAFEDALQWLIETGLIHRATRITTPRIPLASYAERDNFKLYMLDVGLLAAKAEVELKTFLNPDARIFKEFNGAFAEQFIMQELKALGITPYYWGRDKGAAEIDFIMQYNGEVVPLEVKAGIRKQSKSLDFYRKEYQPLYVIRSSLNNIGNVNGLYSIPLYMIAEFCNIF